MQKQDNNMGKNLTISCTGCSLADYLYTDIDFSRPDIKKYLSIKNGDGGITPGKLVFTENFEHFSGESIPTIINNITQNKQPDTFNLGGPAIVALIGTAQLLNNKNIKCKFYGVTGSDKAGEKIHRLIKKLPIDTYNYNSMRGTTPYTIVLSDPQLNNGKGERAFINNIGVNHKYLSSNLGKDFFDSDILIYGATALVPHIHSDLTALLRKGRNLGKLNIVTTVYDFINEEANPNKPWPLGESNESYKLLDLLLVDYEEALRLSNKPNLSDSISFFVKMGVSAMVITHGSKPITFFSNGTLFNKITPSILPICKAVDIELKKYPEIKGDTTGCGDNFAGGVIYSLINQVVNNKKPDLTEAVRWGSVAGGFARFYIGGTYFEKEQGEKISKLLPFYKAYELETNTKKLLPNKSYSSI